MKHLNFENKRVLMRVDFNVPLNDENIITDDTRIRKAIPTIKFILEEGGCVILMSHLGRPQKKRLENGDINVEKFTLRHLVKDLTEKLQVEVQFVDDCAGPDARMKARNLKPGQVLLLENTRFYKGESEGDEDLAYKLASLGEIFINDAFGTAHRAHASTTIVAQHFDLAHKGFGFLMEAEIENADKVLKSPKRPLTAIIGGAKVSDKIQLLERLIDFCENLVIGGGMAYTFIKAQGGNVGNSLVEKDYLDLANEILEKAKSNNVDIYLPADSIIADKFDANANAKTASSDRIEDDWMGLDIGPLAVDRFRKVILNSKTILWNGPLGVFEFEKFKQGTFEIANAVAEATQNGAFSLIGGGDSVAAINQAGLAEKVSFVSTGGGAMLNYLEGKVLPGIRAIQEQESE
jgi:phosphoglycerate kinase